MFILSTRLNLGKCFHSVFSIWDECFSILSLFSILSCLVALLVFLLGSICLKCFILVGNTLLSDGSEFPWRFCFWEHRSEVLRWIRLSNRRFLQLRMSYQEMSLHFFFCGSTITRNDIQSVIHFHHIATGDSHIQTFFGVFSRVKFWMV